MSSEMNSAEIHYFDHTDYWCYDHEVVHRVRLVDPMPPCHMVSPVPEEQRIIQEAEDILRRRSQEGAL